DNFKVTHPADFTRAAQTLRQWQAKDKPMDFRTGQGFDVHAFEAGDHVTLCGVKILHSQSLKGHSDADVAMHAVTDAIYGALADGDIGQHFPPSDPQWKGAASEIFLRHAVDLAASRGFTITHTDCTIICERPKIGPHALAMREEMARLMGLDLDRVSVKATTSEKLGFTGREEGIAALATASLVKL
ncbi:MAG: 2-C-methyl-D-erythritol 2,4-cyclodiphosphate synthase, partial [Mangrovicoccus sp.]